ncbi:MAG: molybdopterin-dependent oxidoreductase [Pirellulaceae bacterium]|nr:molybdopterin-dependent oxidoreductase [Pirellulaceae bacterium]
MSDSHSIQRRTYCNRDCPDACGIVATIEDGRVVRLQGDNDHPVTQGFLCYRTSRFLEHQYDPQRITSPLMRRNGSLEPVSWEVALDCIAKKLIQVKEESGPAAILHYRSGGSMGMMKFVTNYFFEQLGPVAIKSGNVCSGAGDAAQLTDFGDKDSHDMFDVLHSKTILIWGKNVYNSSVHLLPVLQEAKKRGAQILLIDPVYHRTAQLCDHYFQPRPGSDMAIALGMAQVFFERNYCDPNAGKYCDHLDSFRELVYSQSLSEWSQQTDLQVEDIELLAELYHRGPSSIQVGWGMQRRTWGSSTIRVLDALAAISGNLGIPGGGVCFSSKWLGNFNMSFLKGMAAAPRTIPEPLLGPSILEAKDPPIRFVWVTCANPVTMLPESLTVARALESRELTVVVDAFLTDTARCADVVLPTTTMLEDDDILGSYGHHWIAESRPVVPPPPNVKTDFQIIQELAPRVGLGDTFSEDVDTWKKRILERVAPGGATLDKLRTGPVRDPLSTEVLFADRKFHTSSGKVNLFHEPLLEPPSVSKERPLFLMAVSTDKAQASQWLPGTQQGPAEARLHPDAAPAFADGDRARLESEVAELTVILRFDERQRRDVVLMDKGGWLSAGRCANTLVPARATDAGGCAVYYDTPVRVLPDVQE